MRKTIEQNASKTILQAPKEVKVGDTVYEVAPPTMATLILASELISQLPATKLDNNNILFETLSIAKDCRLVGDIVATIILGARNLTSEKETVKTHCFGFLKKKKTVHINNLSELSKKLIEELSPAELNNVFAEILKTMQISDFFGLTSSLLEINLLRQTREEETIVFGL